MSVDQEVWHHHSFRGRPNDITPCASKCRVRSVISDLSAPYCGSITIVWVDLPGAVYSVWLTISKRSVRDSASGWPLERLADTLRVWERHPTHPVIRIKFALNLNSPVYLTLTSGKQKYTPAAPSAFTISAGVVNRVPYTIATTSPLASWTMVASSPSIVSSVRWTMRKGSSSWL